MVSAFSFPDIISAPTKEAVVSAWPGIYEYQNLLNRLTEKGFGLTNGIYVYSNGFHPAIDLIPARIVRLLSANGTKTTGFLSSFRMIDFDAKHYSFAVSLDYLFFSQVNRWIEFRDYNAMKFFVRVIMERSMNRKPTLISMSVPIEKFISEGARLKMFEEAIIRPFFNKCLRVDVK